MVPLKIEINIHLCEVNIKFLCRFDDPEDLDFKIKVCVMGGLE